MLRKQGAEAQSRMGRGGKGRGGAVVPPTWETQIAGGLADVLFMGPRQARELFPALEYG